MSKNIENKIKKKDSNTVIILKSTAISFFLSLILLLIYCCLLSYTSIRESTMIPVTIIITMIASLIGGLTCTTKIKKNGLINGGIVSFIYITIIYIFSSIVYSNFSLNINSITLIILTVFSGMTGGIIGTNLKKNKYKVY